MSQRAEVIVTTVGEVAAELARAVSIRAIASPLRSSPTIPGRREARLRVIAAGLTDDDIDRLIDEARTEAKLLIQ